ncbi:MAG TPA: hypothetical protein VN372_04235 [Methanospirillum sp.]|nr:hypothetical protein [Methanospirillum sp.]
MASTHIRIPIEVKQRLDRLNLGGESVGTVINRIIDYYESAGAVNSGVNISGDAMDNVVNEALTAQLQDLAARVTALESTRQVLPEVAPDSIFPLVLSESVPDDLQIIDPFQEKEERIILTEEMREQVRARLKNLRSIGISHLEIYEKTRIPEGSQKKLLSPNQSFKSITRCQYDSLMKC